MSRKFVYFAAVSANLMAFLSGISYAWSSPMLPVLKGLHGYNPLPEAISLSEESLITSLLSLGAALGPFLAGFLSHNIGRKRTLIIFSVPMFISNLILTFASSVVLFYISRLLAGLCIGCMFTVAPVFLVEIAETSNRGFISSFLPIMLTLGTLLTYIAGPFVSIQLLGMLALIPSILYFILFGFFVPETPYYLVMQNRINDARDCLSKYRGTKVKDIEKEFNTILDQIRNNQKGGFKDMIRSKAAVKGLIVTNGLFTFQQCSGIVGIMAYLQDIFQKSGSSLSSEVSVMLVGAIQMTSIILSGQLVDRAGRKILLLFSMIGNCIALALIGSYFYLDSKNYDLSQFFWLPVFSVMFYVFSFSFGLGPVPWTITAEIFPENVRAIATTFTSTYVLTLAFFSAQFFQYLVVFLGMANVFFMFAFCCFLGVLFVGFIVPETKGKSYHEIQELLL